MTSVADALAPYRLAVCVGTGGVGKTTVAAALALEAALRGRRAMVLTIDPARALARALGLDQLAGDHQRVALAGAPGVLTAAMLDQKRAWDAFVTRHAPTPAVARALFANPFYQRLSTSFSGSTEYMAIEELCRLADTGEHELVVLDTPPSAHALDFLRAPERLDRLLDREVAGWFARPYERLGRGAWRSLGATARFVLRRLEHAAGAQTLREISMFFVALDALLDEVRARAQRARGLLRGGDVAFVLVASPRQLALDETRALAGKLAAQAAPLVAVVVDRVHAVPPVPLAQAEAELAALGDDPAARWLRAAWDDAVAEATGEAARIAQLAAALPAGIAVAQIAEADHDLHTLADLAAVARALGADQARR